MAGERSVRISFEAREELSRAVQQIDSALDSLKGSIATLDGSLASVSGASEVAEEGLDDFGDEADQATVKLASLVTAIGGYNAQSLKDKDVDIDLDKDQVDRLEAGKMRLSELADLVDDEERFLADPTWSRPKADTEWKELGETIRRQSERDDFQIQLDVDVDRESLSKANQEVRSGADKIEAGSGSIVELKLRIPDGQKTYARLEVAKVTKAIAETDSGKVFLGLRLSDGQITHAQLEVAKATKRIESTASNDISLNFDISSASLERIEANVISIKQQIENSDISTIEMDVNLAFTKLQSIQAKIREWAERVEGYNYTTIDIDVKLDLDDLRSQFAELKTITETMEEVNDINIDVEIDATDDALELFALAAALDKVQAEALVAAAASGGAAGGIDKMGDEAAESAAEMTFLASAMNLMSLNTTALSLNIGAFNIALSNLATQIPILFASIGTLVTGLAGLASAALLAATGVSAIFAGGFLAELTRVEEQFDNIESKAEAMQAIFQSLAEAFLQAVEPLTELTGATDTFFGIINSLLTTVNTFARGIAESFAFGDAQDGLMSLSEFMDVIGQTWNDNLIDITNATMAMSARLLPIIADFFVFFIEGFDDMVMFITRFTEELTNSDMRAGLSALLDFATELIDLGSTVLQGLLPVFAGVITIATEVFSILNQLNPQIIRNVAGFALMAVVVSKAHTALLGAAGAAWQLTLGLASSTLATRLQGIQAAHTAGNITILQAAMLALNRISIAMQARLYGLISATWGYITAIWAKISALGFAVAQTIALAFHSFVLTAAQYGLGGALYAAASGLWAYVAGASAATVGTMLLNGAIALFHILTGGIMAILPALIGGFALLVAAGAGLVGVLGNLDGVTSGLGSALDVIKNVLVTIGSFLLNVFIAAWNVFAIVIEGIIFQVQRAIDALMSIGFVKDAVDTVTSAFGDLMGFLEDLPELAASAFDFLAVKIEDFINMFPDWLKEALGIEGEFSFGAPGEGMTVSREDVVSGAEDAASAVPSLSGKSPNNFNYNEENINNNAMEVNADPEEKETLKRTIKDAMEEANAFSRRNQGHGG